MTYGLGGRSRYPVDTETDDGSSHSYLGGPRVVGVTTRTRMGASRTGDRDKGRFDVGQRCLFT